MDWRFNGPHALCVLRRQRGDGRHAITTERSNRFQISLNACTAVRTGNGQDAWVFKFKSVVAPGEKAFPVVRTWLALG